MLPTVLCVAQFFKRNETAYLILAANDERRWPAPAGFVRE